MSRQLVVVDIETTGLNVATCWPLEISAINVETGEELHFVPFITCSALGNADPGAMRVNRYYERGVWEKMLPDDTCNKESYATLRAMLNGNTLGGSNPRFDAAILTRFMGEVWHHRLADLAAYAAAALHLGPHELVGLDGVCAALKITNREPHSAWGDATAAAECFERLADKYTARTEAEMHI